MKSSKSNNGKMIHRSLKKILFLTVCMGITGAAVAQVLQPNRFELEQKNSDDYFHVISMKDEGLALFRERDKFKGNSRIWELLFLDSTLQEKKNVELTIKERYKMVGYEVMPGLLYLLYRTGETNKNELEIIPVSTTAGELERHTVDPDLDFKLTHFSAVEQTFIFGGYVNNDPAVILYSMHDKKTKVLPGFFQKDTELVDLRVNQNQTFNVILVNRNSRGERNLIFRSFDVNGEMLLEDAVPLEDDKTIQAGISSTLEREDLLIMGTWGERNSKQSYGFFAMSVDPFNDQKINYKHFGELTNYLAYTKPKRAARIKESTQQDLQAGKLPNFSSYVMPYRVVEHKLGFLMLAEIYQPGSNTNPYYSSPYYYNPYYSPYAMSPMGTGYYYPGMSRLYRPYNYGNNVKSNDEVRTQESVLLLFDASGKLVWDYSMVLDDIKTPSTEQVSDFNISNGKVNIVYKKESDLKIKTIVPGEEPVSEQTVKVTTSNSFDEIRSEKESEGGVRHWYGKYYYVYGYQTIRNNTKEDRTRDVFYINRVALY